MCAENHDHDHDHDHADEVGAHDTERAGPPDADAVERALAFMLQEPPPARPASARPAPVAHYRVSDDAGLVGARIIVAEWPGRPSRPSAPQRFAVYVRFPRDAYGTAHGFRVDGSDRVDVSAFVDDVLAAFSEGVREGMVEPWAAKVLPRYPSVRYDRAVGRELETLVAAGEVAG